MKAWLAISAAAIIFSVAVMTTVRAADDPLKVCLDEALPPFLRASTREARQRLRRGPCPGRRGKAGPAARHPMVRKQAQQGLRAPRLKPMPCSRMAAVRWSAAMP